MPNRFTVDPEFELYPVWAPDGRRIAFQSTRRSPRNTNFDIYFKSLNGTGTEELLLARDGGQVPTDWSTDGRFILYSDIGTRPKGIWAVSPDGDRKPFPVVETNLGATGGQFSSDGKWIAYQSRESGGRQEIYVQRFPGPGGKLQVSSAGGVQVRWRHDGKELFYLAPDNQLMAVPIRLDSQHDKVELGTPVSLFTARLSGNSQLSTRRHYMVSSDGQRFLMDTPAEVTKPITVILNWKPKQ